MAATVAVRLLATLEATHKVESGDVVAAVGPGTRHLRRPEELFRVVFFQAERPTESSE